jgi:hypothetical protein
MTREEFEFNFGVLNRQSQWDSLWMNLIQLLSLGTEHEQFAKTVLQGFVCGETPHPDLVWMTMEKLKERATALGMNFQVVAVSREEDARPDYARSAATRLMKTLGIH